MDHSRVPIAPPMERWIAGRAVTTTRASSETMKNATEVSSRTRPGDATRAPAAARDPVTVTGAGDADAMCVMPDLRGSGLRIDSPGGNRGINESVNLVAAQQLIAQRRVA